MNDTRFELRLPALRRDQLDELAAELGLSSAADVARMAIFRLLDDPGGLLKPRDHHSEAA